MSPLTESTRLTLAKDYTRPDDSDAVAYIAAVEAADAAAGQSGGLETATKMAINSFIKGCKADGIWPAIKASCILAGARTLSGALVPLVGTAPTNVGPFVTGDYNRKTGLVGNGSSKYLDSNRNNNADPQNNKHLSVYVSSASTSANNTISSNSYPMYIGAGGGNTGASNIERGPSNSSSLDIRLNGVTQSPVAGAGGATNFIGITRSASSQIEVRTQLATVLISNSSQTPLSGALGIYRDGIGSLVTYSNARLAFYSIGESLNLALLDTRVSALITAFGVAIP